MTRPEGSRNIGPEMLRLVMRLKERGATPAQIAHLLELSPKAVYAILNRKGKSSPKTGRPPKISAQLGRRIKRKAAQSPGIYATEVASDLCPELSIKTVRRTMKKLGIKRRKGLRKPALSLKHKRERLKFARLHVGRPLSFWYRVLWSDESKICDTQTPRTHVYRPDGQALNPQYVVPTFKSGRSSIMVWGCCSANGVGRLHHVDTNMDAHVYRGVLRKNLWESKRMLNLPGNWIFQQDNDPKHSAGDTQKFLDRKLVNTLDWPANSPDLNIIEHLWEKLKVELRALGSIPKARLFSETKRVWETIPPESVRVLVDSMPRRLKAVIKARGGYTKY